MPRKQLRLPKRSVIEPMERRLLLAATPPAVLSGSVLTVTGSPGADAIGVNFDLASGSTPDSFVITVNGTVQSFPAAKLTAIAVNSLGGNDSVNVQIPEVTDLTPYGVNGFFGISVNCGDGNDTVVTDCTASDDGMNFEGPFITQYRTSVALGNGNDSWSSFSGQYTVTAGNGNDTFFSQSGDFLYPDDVSVTAGNGNDSFTLTDPDADYAFGNFSAGSGRDTFDLANTSRQFDSATCEADGGPSFVLTPSLSAITGKAFVDNNSDGVFDAGDTPLAGATISVTPVAPFLTAQTTTTSANGNYVFSNISSANSIDQAYGAVIAVVPPAGYAAAPVAAQVASAVIYNRSDGVGVADVNPYVYKPTAKSTGTLLATAGSYQNDGNTAAKAVDGNLSTFFDGPTANGNYVGLDLGSAKQIASISYAPRAGYTSRMVGGIFQGSNSANFSSPVTLDTITTAPTAGVLTTVPVSVTTPFRYVRYLSPAGSYGDVAEVQFSSPAPVPTGSITVHLYNDENADGVQDANEPNLVGWGTFLDFNDDGIFDGSDVRMISNTSGNMTFSGLAPGLYYVNQNIPAGFQTDPAVGAFATDYGFPVAVLVNANSTSTVTVGEYQSHSELTGTPIGTAGSYGNSGNTIANAFDGNLVSYFDAPIATGAWVGLDLGTAQVVTQVRYTPRPSFESRMIGGEIQASNSANFSSGVVTLATITAYPSPGVLNTLALTNATAYRYYRYLGPANSYCDIAELQFDGVD